MRAKFAFIEKDKINQLIQDGELNECDIVYTKDTHENYFISPDLEPIAIKSTIYCFDSEEQAVEVLNNSSDTYEGMIVSILKNDKYKAYIVNKIDEQYFVQQISSSIDIDELKEMLDAEYFKIENDKVTLAENVITQKDTVILYGGSATEVMA